MQNYYHHGDRWQLAVQNKRGNKKTKQKNNPKATFLRCAWFRLLRLRSRLFGLVGKVILSFFFFLIVIPWSLHPERDRSWWQLGGGVGEEEVWGVELYRPGIFIYIYNSEPPLRLRGGEVETLGCNGMTGCWDGWGWRGREAGRGVSFDSFDGVALRSHWIQLQAHTTTWGQFPCSHRTKTALNTTAWMEGRWRYTLNHGEDSPQVSTLTLSSCSPPTPILPWFCCHGRIAASLLLPVHPAWPHHPS